jgi:hypothetical protein
MSMNRAYRLEDVEDFAAAIHESLPHFIKEILPDQVLRAARIELTNALLSLVNADDEKILSIWKKYMLPDETAKDFYVRIIHSNKHKAIVGIRYNVVAQKRFLNVYVQTIKNSVSLKEDVRDLISAIHAAFADKPYAAINVTLAGNIPEYFFTDIKGHADAYRLMGRIEPYPLEIPSGVFLKREMNLNFLPFLKEAYDEHKRFHPFAIESYQEGIIRNAIETGGVISIYDKKTAEWIGLSAWNLVKDDVLKVPVFRLDEVVVRQPFQNKGLGTLLRKACVTGMYEALKEKPDALFQTGEIACYNKPSLSGAFASGRKVVWTSFWFDRDEKNFWAKPLL